MQTSSTIADRTLDLRSLFDQQRAILQTIKQRSYTERIKSLKKLESALHTHRIAIHKALKQDFNKPSEETDVTEISVVLSEIAHACKHLKHWMAPKSTRTPLKLIGTRSEVIVEPRGTCLIIAPWNYPLNLALCPLVSAIAAGNTAILKPSEHAPHTSKLLNWILAETFVPEEVAVVEGDVEVAQALLELPFDHIFFTGSTAVGKLVMQAAARHLSSVTLELGGKSPVLIDASASLKVTAERIVYGKFSNAGQTCIAPDYLLVHESVHDQLIDELKTQIRRFYPFSSMGVGQIYRDYAHIISDRHLSRLKHLLEDAVSNGASIATGGSINTETRYLAPTVLTGVTSNMVIMQEEIFGPILPMIPYSNIKEALDLINSRPKPLALYIFSQSTAFNDQVIRNTSSGGVAINETLLQYAHPDLPFGGVNHSGIGKAHGIYGFKAFSNERAVLKQRTPRSPLKFFYPPYSNRTRSLIDYLLRYL